MWYKSTIPIIYRNHTLYSQRFSVGVFQNTKLNCKRWVIKQHWATGMFCEKLLNHCPYLTNALVQEKNTTPPSVTEIETSFCWAGQALKTET